MLSIFATLLYLVHPAAAQPKPKDAECLACHSDPQPSADGKTTHPAVNADKEKASVHGGMFSCVDCHPATSPQPDSAKLNPATSPAPGGPANPE